jgi:hypothetical protein
MIKENLKIKNTLKKLYENQEFESSFEDAVTGWNDNETINEEYVFRYFMEVGKVLGEEDRTVASINVIITDIQKDDDDYYYDWADNNDYSEYTWYIDELKKTLTEEMNTDFPISTYLTFYGYDEYENLPLDKRNL